MLLKYALCPSCRPSCTVGAGGKCDRSLVINRRPLLQIDCNLRSF